MKLNVNDIEHATILAALRCYQQHLNLNGGFPGADFHDIATNTGAFNAMDDDAIDQLCENINTGGTEDSNRESILHSIYTELEDMGFGTDQDVDGGDFVEWGGQVFNDIREAFERDGVPVPVAEPDESEPAS